MIQTGTGEVTITSDSASILKQTSAIERLFLLYIFQLVELSKVQDIQADDRITPVVVIAGSLLDAASHLVASGMNV